MGQVLIRVAWASICGTDLHIFLGEFKDRVAYPRVLGHELSGVIESLGPGVSGLDLGDRVVADPIIWCGRCPACLMGHNNVCANLELIGIDRDGAFAELVVVDAEKVFKIPKGLGLKEAALSELYALGVHSTRKANVEPGDKVAILGAGRLGLAVLEVIRHTAASFVASVDVLPKRLEIANKIGADLVLDAGQLEPVQAILAATGGQGVDKVVETIGTAVPLPGRDWPPQQAVRMARHGGRVVLMGLGSQSTPVLWKEVALKELEMVGSRVTQGDFPRAVELLAQERFHPQLLISREYNLDHINEAFQNLEENPSEYVKLLIEIK